MVLSNVAMGIPDVNTDDVNTDEILREMGSVGTWVSAAPAACSGAGVRKKV